MENGSNNFSNILIIKSIYIIKDIFELLCENKKLDMIIYNKKLQKIFEINIDIYKNKSHKYIIGERNGIGKEYLKNTNILIFKGEYKNGKKMVKVRNIILMEI